MVRSLKPDTRGTGKPTGVAPRRLAARLSVSVFAVMSVGLLFVSYFGPLIDHHFTERLPQHTHVYLGDVEPEHTHPFEEAHSHTVSFDEAAPHLHDGSRDTTVYLAPDDNAGPNSLDARSNPIIQSMTYPPLDHSRPSYLANERDLKANFISPPIRPPRV